MDYYTKGKLLKMCRLGGCNSIETIEVINIFNQAERKGEFSFDDLHSILGLVPGMLYMIKVEKDRLLNLSMTGHCIFNFIRDQLHNL